MSKLGVLKFPVSITRLFLISNMLKICIISAIEAEGKVRSSEVDISTPTHSSQNYG